MTGMKQETEYKRLTRNTTANVHIAHIGAKGNE